MNSVACFKSSKRPEELCRVQRGPVDHHGHALGFHAIHEAPDGAHTEIVGVRLHHPTTGLELPS